MLVRDAGVGAGARPRGVHAATPPELGLRGRARTCSPGGRSTTTTGRPRPRRRAPAAATPRPAPCWASTSGGLAFWVAALRECFEEAGVLLAYRGTVPAGGDVALLDVARRGYPARDWRRCGWRSTRVRSVSSTPVGREGLRLATDRVHYFSHWITPEPAPKRYDTRFFVAALPPGQVPVHDDYETVDTVWVRPARRPGAGRGGGVRPHLPHHEEPRGDQAFRHQR